jgi:hypothetical protein
MAKAVIINDHQGRVGYVKQSNYFKSKVSSETKYSKIISKLPFRVRFVTIGVEGYGPNNVPPIGIAIVGVNNYVI